MDTDLIKKTIEELLVKLGFSFQEVSISNDQFGNVRFVIKAVDSGPIIGFKGENLYALNHIVKKIIAGKTKEEGKFSLDVNDYQESNITHIKNKATILAERVKSFKRDFEMDPMSSYERMIVHSLLADMPNIKTESSGEGRERKVVIKYIEKENGGQI